MGQQFKGYLFALLATVIWSSNFIIARNLSPDIPPVSLAFWRWTVGLIILSPFAIKSFIREFHLVKKHLAYLLFTSFFGITLFNTLLYMASKTTPALNLSLISISFPIFVILLSRFWKKEEITFYKVPGILLVAVGVIIIITKGSPLLLFKLSFFKGDIYMLIAAISFAVYSILLKQKPEGFSMFSFLFATFILGLLMLSPFYLWELSLTTTHYNAVSVKSILYLGFFASFLAYIFWNKAILILGPTKASMVYYTLPLFSGLLAFIILKESLFSYHAFSAVLIFSGIILSNSDLSKKNRK